MKKSQIPQALRLGARAGGWDSIEIDQWIAERLNHRTWPVLPRTSHSQPESAMQVVSIISTKGGVGKTTTAANLGGLAADAGLDLVLSNDHRGELNTLLLHAPDGRLRLRHLLPALAPLYDLVLIDTQGARSVLLEMAVLASDLALSPVTPEILAARELRRGTMQLLEDIAPYRHLGIEPPPLLLLINRVHPVSANARLIQQALRDLFQDHAGIRVLATDVPAIEAYPRAATRGLPVHRVEHRQPPGRVAPAALDTMRGLATELFPQWKDRFAQVAGRAPCPLDSGRRHG